MRTERSTHVQCFDTSRYVSVACIHAYDNIGRKQQTQCNVGLMLYYVTTFSVT